MAISDNSARNQFLADPDWLAAHLSDPDLVLVDVDGEAGYRRGHIPGALMVPSDYERDPSTGLVSTFPPQKFAETCQSLGIGDGTQVVVYDNNMSLYAARFWWVLNYYGHANVKVLDGGWRRWVSESRPVSFEEAAPTPGAGFTPRADESLLGTLEEVKAACELGDSIVLDVRTGDEYSGAASRRGVRPGHIPGALHLDWSDLMDRDSHRFKPDDQLHQLFAERGVAPDKAVFTY